MTKARTKARAQARVPWRIYSEAAPLACRSCDLCGGDIAAVLVVNRFTDPDGATRVACDDCAFTAPHELRWRVLNSAAEVERCAAERAATLRALADLVAPGDRAAHDRLVATADTVTPPQLPNQLHQPSPEEI